jgi:hypothetical protein
VEPPWSFASGPDGGSAIEETWTNPSPAATPAGWGVLVFDE